ncbi:MAG: hypothetical protein HY671_00155 [Chloroflexi bacterium]|nr:hypothetical protein [Chloroflexota bacterium]
MEESNSSARHGTAQDIRWAAVWSGYSVGLASTIVVGTPLVLIMRSSWLLAIAGSAGLFAGGFVTGRKVGSQLAVVNGALMAILYNLTLSLAYFVGSFLELLPEPLPGLPQGDSTFFFAWPLAQFAIGIAAAISGSRKKQTNTRRVT